jgi:hypothetical protein
MTATGLPCADLLALYSQFSCGEIQRIAESDTIEEIDQDETRTTDECLENTNDMDADPIALSAGRRQRALYLHLFHLAKQIAQKGSKAAARYQEL